MSKMLDPMSWLQDGEVPACDKECGVFCTFVQKLEGQSPSQVAAGGVPLTPRPPHSFSLQE